MRRGVALLAEQLWGGQDKPGQRFFEANNFATETFLALNDLAPKTDTQRVIKEQALQTAIAVQRSRLMLFEIADAGLPVPFLVVLIFWLTMIFASYCLFSTLNPTSAVALVLIALSASGAIFLILEMNTPFEGIIQLSSASLRTALPPLPQ